MFFLVTMNRRDLLKFLGVGTSIFVACEPSLPSTPTIAKIKVINEANLPVEGLEFQFIVTSHTISSVKKIYEDYKSTGADGEVQFSYVVPTGANNVEIAPSGGKYKLGIDYYVYFFVNGQYSDAGSVLPIRFENFGKSVIFNLLLKKI